MLNEIIFLLLPIFFIFYWIGKYVCLSEFKTRFQNARYVSRRLNNEEIIALKNVCSINEGYVFVEKGKMRRAFSWPFSNKVYYRVNYIKVLVPAEMEAWIKMNDINEVELIFVGVKAIAVKINHVDSLYLSQKKQNNDDWFAQKKKIYYSFFNEMIKSFLVNAPVDQKDIPQNDFLKDNFYQLVSSRKLSSCEYQKIKSYTTKKVVKPIYLLLSAMVFLVLLQSTLLNYFFFVFVAAIVTCLLAIPIFLIKNKITKLSNKVNKVIGTITGFDHKAQELVLNDELIIRIPQQWSKFIVLDIGKLVTLEVCIDNNQLVSYNDCLFLDTEKQFCKNFDLPLLTKLAKFAIVIMLFTSMMVISSNFVVIADLFNPTRQAVAKENIISLENVHETIAQLFEKDEVVKFDNVPAFCVPSYQPEECRSILIVDEQALKHYIKSKSIDDIYYYDTTKAKATLKLIENNFIQYDESTGRVTNPNELIPLARSICDFSSPLFYVNSSECNEFQSIAQRIRLNSETPQDIDRLVQFIKSDLGGTIIYYLFSRENEENKSEFLSKLNKAIVINIDGKSLLPDLSEYSYSTSIKEKRRYIADKNEEWKFNFY